MIRCFCGPVKASQLHNVCWNERWRATSCAASARQCATSASSFESCARSPLGTAAPRGAADAPAAEAKQDADDDDSWAEFY